VTDTAALANEVEATLENALETILDPPVAAAAQETFHSAEEVMHRVRLALGDAAVELRARVARLEAVAVPAADGADPHLSAHAAEVAAQLRDLALRLEDPGAWQIVDRVVHELVSDLLVGALDVPGRGASSTLTARAIAIGVLAGNDTLWTGAGQRLGCAYGYDSLLALVRTASRAA
jgi:hypothetical protein